MRADQPSETVPMTAAVGEQAQAGCGRAVAEDALHVQGDDDLEPERGGDHQELGEACPVMSRTEKMRSGSSGVWAVAWRVRNAARGATAKAAARKVRADSQPYRVVPTIA